jgi:hypothetical protein
MYSKIGVVIAQTPKQAKFTAINYYKEYIIKRATFIKNDSRYGYKEYAIYGRKKKE